MSLRSTLITFRAFTLHSFHLDTPRRHQIATGGSGAGTSQAEVETKNFDAKVVPNYISTASLGIGGIWWDMVGYG